MNDATKFIQVATGLAFVYTSFALLVSALSEWISSALQWRANNLREGIASMLLDAKDPSGKPIVDKFYDHPVITAIRQESLFRRLFDCRLPAYIPKELFSRVLPQILAPAGWNMDGTMTGADLRNIIAGLEDPKLAQLLRTVLDGHYDTIESSRTALEAWFDAANDRFSSWYTRKMWFRTFLLSAAVAVLLRIDSIEIVERLWDDPATRARAVAAANQMLPELKQQVMALEKSAPVPGLPVQPATPKAVEPAPAKTTTETTAKKAAAPPPPVVTESTTAPVPVAAGSVPTPGPSPTAETEKLLHELDTLRSRLSGIALPEKDEKISAITFVRQRLESVEKEARKPDLPVGWEISDDPATWSRWLVAHARPLLGLAITALAVSMGAKFWFDLLGRFVNVNLNAGPSDAKA